MSSETGISRRTLLGLGVGGAIGLAGGAVAGRATADPNPPAATGPGGEPKIVPFHGPHQAGIGTAAQDRLHFAALDVLPGTGRDDLAQLLRDWTAAAFAMTEGRTVGGPAGSQIQDAAPLDTGEAQGLDPANLTVTIGFGQSLFDRRFGLAGRRPRALTGLPVFPGDALDPARSGGDIAIQACSDDPQVAVHAVRNLVRIGHGVTAVRFSQLGFGRTSSTTSAQVTPRNLLGFKDGTANLRSDDEQAMAEHVWVGAGDEPGAGSWMTGGSYMVARRIRMHIETWDRDPLEDQERVIGRQRLSGAPFGADDEFAELDLAKVDPDAHVARTHPTRNDGIKLLRRGYSFVDGSDQLGRLDAGLFFLSFQRSPERFVRVQRNLAGKHRDLLNEYTVHVGSGLYAVPPGLRDERDWWGRTLFAAA